MQFTQNTSEYMKHNGASSALATLGRDVIVSGAGVVDAVVHRPHTKHIVEPHPHDIASHGERGGPKVNFGSFNLFPIHRN